MARIIKKKKKRLLPKQTGYAILLIAMALVSLGFLAILAVVNAFPTSMTLGLIIVMIVAIILAGFLFHRGKKWARILGVVLAVVFIGIYGMGIYYMSSTYAMFARISTEDDDMQGLADAVDVTNQAFNIYITGIDQWESEKGKDLERSDVNMIVTVNPNTRKILLTSIPRDSYVPLHRTGTMDKLTHTGIYGVDETLNTVQDWLSVDLNYYVKMNFSAVVDVINAMGGVDVYSDKSFKPVKRPWWMVKKGWNHMNGKQALAFARERKAYNSEDSKRVENQQKVVEAALKKMMSSSTLLTKYGDILAAAGDNMETNLSSREMQAVVKMQLADLGAWDIEMQKIEGKYDMDYVASLTQESKFLVYKTKKDSREAKVEKINAVMNPTAKEIAEATARRQKNSIIEFIKTILHKED